MGVENRMCGGFTHAQGIHYKHTVLGTMASKQTFWLECKAVESTLSDLSDLSTGN